MHMQACIQQYNDQELHAVINFVIIVNHSHHFMFCKLTIHGKILNVDSYFWILNEYWHCLLISIKFNEFRIGIFFMS